MSRRFYIVSYDVTDDKRRTRVYKALLGYGDRVQYSVFCCQLNPRERVQMETRLRDEIHHDDDQVLVVDAGPVRGAQPEPEVAYVGKTWKPQPRSLVV
ncbi:MAG: CRISPR-associated endonuclease Cas2 [Lentisphaerae bacterium]|nr:CRISPR-associated endonuclease Cas2 [Lentisphaerota bacterium]